MIIDVNYYMEINYYHVFQEKSLVSKTAEMQLFQKVIWWKPSASIYPRHHELIPPDANWRDSVYPVSRLNTLRLEKQGKCMVHFILVVMENSFIA